MEVAPSLLAKRKGYRLTDEAYKLVSWTEDNPCYCSACSCPACASCENGLPEEIAYEYDEFWEVDPEYEEEVEMSRSKIIDKTKKDPPEYKVGDKVKVLKDTGSHGIKTGTVLTLKSRHSQAIWWKVEENSMNIPEDDIQLVTETIAQPPKEVYHTAVVKFENYPKEYYYRISDKHYQEIVGRKGGKLEVDVNGERKTVELVRVLTYLVDERATRDIQKVVFVGYDPVKKHLDPLEQIDYYDSRIESNNREIIRLEGEVAKTEVKIELNINQQEESKMSNVTRRVVNIQLVDEDAGLPVEHSLVGKFEDVVTEDSDSVTIQELISTGEVAKLLEAHNKVRVEQDNIEIQNRTGNTVKLRPVKLKDLSWKIK